ncbi:HAMP domain-containing histidine kinase [Shewanella sp. MMG014]|uniref:sensor histidine kinase n=1 Tax=Shewanella sp. MMG014 TaxID=2822691 RepID=UPI001B36CC23|nr:HAMP domain-containing sensor histidine kinase [Shewanella sp. MMG014]MBQ4889436.1 HAMP domain-containing histidine kinase [Shewanella sp. MMG014]
MDTFIIFNIYLFYGLVFFTIGCVVVFRNFKYSQLSISSTLWALALFGFSHAFHEWSELYVILFRDELPNQYQYVVQWLRLIKLSLSFAGLMIFAWLLFRIIPKPYSKVGQIITALIVVIYTLVMLFFYQGTSLLADTFSEAASYTRVLLGFGSATLAGIGIAIYGYQLRQESHEYGQYFIATGFGLVLYGVLAGLVPTSFHSVVPVLRTLAAALVLVTLYKALKIFDIEKEAATEAKLKRAVEADKYKAIGHLAMGVAHEINNPLASSMLALDLLERKIPQQQVGVADYILRARLGIDRASVISKELLTYARADLSHSQKVYFCDVIEGAKQLLSHKLAPYTLTVNCDNNVYVTGQKVKLEELLINLLNNAMDASDTNGSIDINVAADEQAVVVEITDYGEGMDMQTLTRATELFYSTKPIGKGTGLGLAICEQIVSNHHGSMQLMSAKGVGTRVLINFTLRNEHNG